MKKTLGQLADLVRGSIIGDDSAEVSGIAGITEAGPEHITFLANPKYTSFVQSTNAAAIIVDKEMPSPKPLLVTDNPYLAYAKIAQLFFQPPFEPFGVSPEAYIDKSARLGKDISIHPLVYVGKDAVVGDRTVLRPGVVIESEVEIGEDCLIHSNVTILQRCRVGDRVIIHSGAVVGSDGFGFARDKEVYIKIPQVGIVQIDDDVEIGANCTVDRAAMGRTWIKRGVKIDNLVQIAHNVVVGENTLLVAQVGISGSVEVGRNVVLAGQVGVVGHIKIGNNVKVGGQSGVAQSIPDGGIVSGAPAIPHGQWLRMVGITPKLPEMYKRLAKLEARIRALEEDRSGGQS
jgi:UDP-3-O-[3-hydroxymyristoyl] glucosamine N-acyltransferase